VQAATTLELAVGTLTTALNTEMNSIANGGYTAAGPVIDNRIGQSGNGYMQCRVVGHFVFAAAPSSGGSITGWFLKNGDPTTPVYETTPTGSITLTRLPDFVIPAVTGSATTDTSVDVRCPAERFKVVILNFATNQTLNGGGVNTIKLLPITIQGN
jgi:hypothetical protein